MQLKYDPLKPMYVQIAEAIEDSIIQGELIEGEQCYSQIVIAKELGINPATASKGINILVDAGILIKQRGMAMVISKGAKSIIVEKRKSNKLQSMIDDLVNEATKLDVSVNSIIAMINEKMKGKEVSDNE